VCDLDVTSHIYKAQTWHPRQQASSHTPRGPSQTSKCTTTRSLQRYCTASCCCNHTKSLSALLQRACGTASTGRLQDIAAPPVMELRNPSADPVPKRCTHTDSPPTPRELPRLPAPQVSCNNSSYTCRCCGLLTGCLMPTAAVRTCYVCFSGPVHAAVCLLTVECQWMAAHKVWVPSWPGCLRAAAGSRTP
jgi:hypothetical protein